MRLRRFCSLIHDKMVLPVRIELTASPLPRECSTTELRQHRAGARPRMRGAPMEKRAGPVKALRPSRRRMAKDLEREKRLVAALRANLRKRKALARGDGGPVKQPVVPGIAPGRGVED
jgi:hypothetical protein